MPIKEAYDDMVNFFRFWKVGIDEECVPHAVPYVQFSFDAKIRKGCLSAKQRTNREVPRSGEKERRWKFGEDIGRVDGQY